MVSSAGQGERRVSAVVRECHRLLRDVVRPGDRVVDATCGNGHDTVFLAGLVAPSGRVWAFDVQDPALAAARSLLEAHGLCDRVELVHAGHEEMASHVMAAVRAVVFNLGYLPGGDKERITLPHTTVAALQQARQLVAPGGCIAVVVYPGHAGGAEEAAAVDSWAAGLPSVQWRVRKWREGERPQAAYLVVADKLADEDVSQGKPPFLP